MALAVLGLRELFVELTARHALSFPAWPPLLAMDRIDYRGLEPLACARLTGDPWRALSDHIALSGTFRLT